MSFLGNVVSSVAKAVTDPGAVVKDAVNTLLPKTLSVVGDIAGAVVDFQKGRPLESLLHGAEALRDLPQALHGLSGGTSGAAAGPGSAAFQPSPPTPRGAVTVTTSLTVTTSSPWRGTPPQSAAAPAATASHPASGAPPQQPFANSAVVGRALGSDALERSVQSLVTALLRSLGGQSALAHPTSASAASPGGSGVGSTANPTAGPPTTHPSVAGDSPSTKAAPSNKQTSAAAGASTATPKNLSDLLALGDSDFMKAMTSGSLPADVKNDPTAMLQIQARMNQISQMTELLSTMMKAMHDMQMAVVQNVRV